MYSNTETSATNGAVMICAMLEKIHEPKNELPPIAVKIPLTMPAMIAATKITPSVCHQLPLTSRHERDIESTAPRRSMMNAGTDTDKNTRKMMPGMIRQDEPDPDDQTRSTGPARSTRRAARTRTGSWRSTSTSRPSDGRGAAAGDRAGEELLDRRPR